MDIARLGLAVDSSQVEKGTVSLHQLTGAAGQASAAAQRLAGSSKVEEAAQRTATSATVAHTAALNAQNAVIRSSMHQRTMMIYQLNDVVVSLASGMNPAMVAMQQGSQILQGGFAPALRTITDLAKGFLVTFWPVAAAVGAAAAAVAGLTYEINKTSDVHVSFFDTVQAGWSLLAENIGNLLSPVWDWFVSSLQWVWDQIAPILKNMGNGIIRPFAFGVEAIGVLWQKLPAAMGDVMITTANVIVSGIEWSINGATRLINEFLSKYNEGLSALGQKTIPLAPGITIPRAANPYQGALGELGSGLDAANMSANSTDYMGNMFGALSDRAQQIALAKGQVEALGGAASAANDNVKKLADDGLKSAADRADDLAKNLGKSIGGALKDLISGAKDFGQVMFDVLGNIAQYMFQQSAGLFGGMGGGFGFFGSLLSGLFGGGFASGGYTGNGAAHEAAGIVHRGEYVFSANATKRIGVGNLDAMHTAAKGYAGGGYVTGAQGGGASSVHVTVGVSVDDEGKLQAYVKSISQQEAQTAAAAGAQVATAQANKTAPAAVAQYQQKRAGGDYRTM